MRVLRPLALGVPAVLIAGSIGLTAPVVHAAVADVNLTAPGLYQCVVGGSGLQVLNYSVSGGMGGGYPNNAAQGGTGANLAGTMTLTGGQTVYITVGSNGVNGATWPFPGGGGDTAQTGSGGGGYSAISLGLNSNPIVIAGGGGGGGSLIAPGGSAIPGTSPHGQGGAGNGGNSQGNQGITGGIQSTSGKGGTAGGGNGGTPGSSGANGVVGFGAAGGGAGFGQTSGGAGDWDTSSSNGYPFTTWNGSPGPFGGGGGGGLWSGGGGGGWSGGGGAGGTDEFPSADGGGGGGGSSLLATSNSAGVTATQSSASSGSTAGSASLAGVSCSTSVTYMANGGTGAIPVDSNWYAAGSSATVLNGNSLTGPGSSPYFVGWSTSQGQGSVQYAPGATITVNGPTVLWAQYTAGTTISFNANGGTGTMLNQAGITPASLNSNLYSRSGYGFLGWNTAANGSGTAYADGATFPFSATSQTVTLYAQWAPVVTVTYNGNGSTYPAFPTYQTGYEPGPLEPISGFLPPNGYIFTGWNTAANGSGTGYQTGQLYAFNADLTLYAQFAVASGIDFNANGGTGTMYNQIIYQPSVINPNLFVRSGYAFTGWNTAADGSGTAYAGGAVFPYLPNVSTMLYAQWGTPSGTVTFDANGGSGSMASQSSVVPAALAPNSFTPPTGQGFLGWNTAVDGSGTSYANGAVYAFNVDLTLYAQWSAASTVTFDANGGSGTMAPQSASVSTTLSPNAFGPPAVGQVFVGWNTAPAGTGTAYSNGAPYPFAADATLYAQWSSSAFTVAFVANGGAGVMPQQSSAVAAPLTPNSFTWMGYDFTGWNTAADGTGVTYADGAQYPFTAGVALYAQWAAAEFTVAFNANGGSGSMPSQVADSPTALSANAFTPPPGQVFNSWNTAADGTGVGYAAGAIYPFAADTTLYAQWSASAATVTFDGNGGSGSMAPQSAVVPTPLATNTFTRTGFTFAGWNTAANGSGTAYADGASYPFSVSATLYAQWKGAETYVLFDANGGAGRMNPQFAAAPTALKPNAFTRTGFTFAGWNTAANGSGTSYADGAVYPFSAITSLYAQWSPAPASYTVTFNANGGTGAMAPQTGGVPASLDINTFRKAGYSFVAWTTNQDGTGATYANGAQYPFNADATLYAQWVDTASKVVTFDPNGGTGSMAPQVSNRPASLTPNAYTRPGYTFTGWNTAANGSGLTYANQSRFPFASNARLFAQWSANAPVVTGLSATQAGASQVAVSWKPLKGGGATYRVTLYSASEVVRGSCVTSGKSCTIKGVPAGTFTVTATVTVKGSTGRPALASVTVIAKKPDLTRAWRGSGTDTTSAYATVVIPQGADPSKALVWTLIARSGKPTWTSQPVVRDAWTCRYTTSETLCTWSRPVPKAAKIKFSVNGLWTRVAAYPSPKRT